MNLVEALKPRMRLIAEVMCQRVDPGAWRGYTSEEPLFGTYKKPADMGHCPMVEYRRHDNVDACIALGFLSMVDLIEEDDYAHTSASTVEEAHEFDVEFKHPIHYSEKVQHEFERTTSRELAHKAAWEIAAKASLSIEYAGIGASLEICGKYGEELSNRVSTTESQRDLVETLLEFTGPAKFRLKAQRSRRQESFIARARCDFDGKIYMQGCASMWEFTTFRTQFIPIIKRIADDSIYGYREFMDNPLSDVMIDLICKPPDKFIEFPVVYDNILSRSLKEI